MLASFDQLEMMRDPLRIRAFSLDPANANPDPINQYSLRWDDLSLANGYPGLVLLFSALEEDAVVHRYVVQIKQAIEAEGLDSLSLFGGVAGICFALQQASLGETRYTRMLDILHGYLLDHIDKRYLHPIRENLDAGRSSSSSLHDPIQGISGVGRYALENLSDSRFLRLAQTIAQTLIKVSLPLLLGGKSVPGWYLDPTDPTNALHAHKKTKGTFNLGLAHGVTGILAFLSIASLRGVEVEGQKEAIQRMASWIEEKSFVKNGAIHWPYSASWEEEVEKQAQSPASSIDAWCYGVPGISRTLFLAGKALHDSRLQNFSLRAFQGVFSRSRTEWGIPGPGLCHGIAGLLLIANEMAKEPGGEEFRSRVVELEEILLSSYTPEAPFGFKDIEPCRSGGRAEVSKVGFLEGTAGILLTLLSLSHSKASWHTPLLIHA